MANAIAHKKPSQIDLFFSAFRLSKYKNVAIVTIALRSRSAKTNELCTKKVKFKLKRTPKSKKLLLVDVNTRKKSRPIKNINKITVACETRIK